MLFALHQQKVNQNAKKLLIKSNRRSNGHET
jgi:hypothetical protein